MKRAAARKLRKEIEAHGVVEVSFESLSHWTGEQPASPLGRSNMARKLKEAGFVTQPEISNLRPATSSIQIRPADRSDSVPAAPSGAAPKLHSRKEQRAAARAEKQRQQAEEDARIQGKIQPYLDKAAGVSDKRAQEQAIGQALQIAQQAQGVFSKKWQNWLEQRLLQMQKSGQIQRGDWIGHVAHVQLFSDRFTWIEGNQLSVQDMDEHVRASIQTAGQISQRPTLTRMAIGSILPGTALIPGLAFKRTTDDRELYFVIEHPTWSKIVQLEPNAKGVAQNLAIQVNQAASQIGYQRKQNEKARREAEKRVKEIELRTSTKAPANAGSTYLDELKELGKLHEAGILTDEEFSAQKARILDRQSS